MYVAAEGSEKTLKSGAQPGRAIQKKSPGTGLCRGLLAGWEA